MKGKVKNFKILRYFDLQKYAVFKIEHKKCYFFSKN